MTLRFRMRRQSDSTYSSSSADADYFPSFVPDASPLLHVDNNDDDVVLRRNESTSSLPQDPPNVIAEEQILSIMDQFEDDWDKHTYEDLVPLQIRLALEEQVFGWSHLTSDILGHFLFTMGAFGVAYICLYHVTQSPNLYWIRWTLSILAGVSSFRMVRRRRQVHLRAPYGSKAYREDEVRRRREVAEVDKTGWIERIRQKSKTRRVERQLKKAEFSFTQHHERRLLRAQSSPIEDDSPLRSMRKQRSFRTDPVPVMQSVQHDQIVFGSGPIQNMHYSHGGFFGAAPFLLANPHWISILRHLMPDVYVEISRRVMKAPPERLIHWAENNPVVAAYGTAQELQYSGIVPNVEWDVFLDPLLVRRVQVVLENREQFLQSTLPQTEGLKPFQTISNSTQLSTEDRNILRFYEVELRMRVRELVDEMLIAHGKLNHLVLEQTGYLKHFNYSRVKRTRRTLGGGIYARQWMAVYAESLKLGVSERSPESSPRSLSSTCLVAMGESTCPDTSIAESVAIVESIAKIKDPVGLVLDVKSRHVPNQVWACVVDALRAAGVRVEGVGCFTIEEIRDMSQYCLKPVKEIVFFHSAGDMQKACHNGRIRDGDTVYFNAGSLLWKPLLHEETYVERICQNCSCYFDPEHIKQSYEIQPFGRVSQSYTESSSGPNQMASTVQSYKQRFNLSIGLYVQEFQIDEKAADILVRLVNDNPDVYDLGLSWGGVNGITIRGIQPGRFTSTDGFWNQRYAGAAWDINLVPPPSAEIL